MPAKRIPSIYEKAARRRLPRAPRERPRVVSSAFSYSPFDAYRQKRPPTAAELAAAYRLLTYACANVIAQACATVDLRLYYRSSPKQSKRAVWGSPRPISKRQHRHLAEHSTRAKYLRQGDEIVEITEHPILDAFNWVNPWLNKFKLFELHQLFLDINGCSFWTFVNDAHGVPCEIWPLPSWMVYPQPDYFGTDVILHYVFMSSGGQVIYPAEEVLYQRGPNLYDPYTQPWGTLQAAYELTQVYDKRTEADDAWLTNLPKAGAIFVPNEDNLINPDEMMRLQLQFEEQTSRARQGTILIAPQDGKVEPLRWSGRDPGQVAAEGMTRKDYATIFGVPMPLIDGTNGSRANLDAAILQLNRFTVKPRLRNTEEHLNSNFLPRFPDADTDRLFLAFDNCAADEVLERETLTVYFDKGWLTRNEVRTELGYERLGPEGDVILVPSAQLPLAEVVQGSPAETRPGERRAANPDPGEVDEAGQGTAPDHVEQPYDEEFGPGYEESDDELIGADTHEGEYGVRRAHTETVAKALSEADVLKRANDLIARLEAEMDENTFSGLDVDGSDAIMPGD